MSDMVESFTLKARKALHLAQSEARLLFHGYIGTEHILLAMAKERDGIIGKVLDHFNVDYNTLRLEVISITSSRENKFIENINFTPMAKLVIRLAVEESRRYGHNYVGSEHLLLGILSSEEGVAIRALNNLGIDAVPAQDKVITYFGSQEQLSLIKSDGKTPSALDKFAVNVTNMARQRKLDPVIGRQEEIERLIHILSRRTKNNPCLIGEPGVGKTAIVEGLAQKIFSGDIPENLYNKEILLLNLSSVIAGAKFRGEFEERLKAIADEITVRKNIILFIDEVHTLVGTGALGGAMDAANILKPALARGEIQVIGATTPDEYRKYIEHDKSLERRFQVIKVSEPDLHQTIEILKGLRDKYEAFHRVRISDEAIVAAVRLSSRHISDRHLPDKAIDLIDEAAAEKRLQNLIVPDEIRQLRREQEENQQEEIAATLAQDYELAARLHCRDLEINSRIKRQTLEWKTIRSVNEQCSVVGSEEIAKIVSRWTGIPVARINSEETKRLLALDEHLHRRVIGQEAPIASVAQAVRRARAGLKDPRRPIGSFIFLGPTGVGKTELAKALAEFIYGTEDAMVRVDMSEYMEKHTVSRLIGAPPGYIGHDEAGQLTEKVRRKPYSVVLFDEIEKAHHEVFNILLQILEDGRLTDSHGRTVSFCNTLIIMTSNVGSSHIRSQYRIGYTAGGDSDAYEKMKEQVMEELKRTFRPEFLNRVDDIIVFHKLNKNHLTAIADLMLSEVRERLQEKAISLSVSPEAKEFLVDDAFDDTLGARPLRRTIQRLIENQLAQSILEGIIRDGQKVNVEMLGEQLEFRVD